MPRGIYKRKNGKMGQPIDKKVEAKVVTWNSNDPNYMETKQMKEHLSIDRRISIDRIDTIIRLLECLKASL